jgi:uracil-DNA glycosylase family 4
MTRIFISYRRADSEGYVGRLYDHLLRHFRPDDLFMDVATIAPGDDFVHAIETAVGSCEVCLVVIGTTWLTVTDASGGRRIDQWNDFVRLEVASALEGGKRIIPVLVGGARMPSPAELPEALAGLARRNAHELTHARFAEDVERLAGAIRSSVSARLIKPKADAETLRRKNATIDALRAALINGTDSPLYAQRVANRLLPVLGDGNPDAGIVFIGEAPGKTEAQQGRPFVGASGKVLDELLGGLRLRRADVFITNLIWDYPGGGEPTPEQIAWYAPHVDRLLLTLDPRVIVPLGRFAAAYVLRLLKRPEQDEKISALHGRLIPARLGDAEIHVVPMLHPAVALYQASQKEALVRGFESLRTFV